MHQFVNQQGLFVCQGKTILVQVRETARGFRRTREEDEAEYAKARQQESGVSGLKNPESRRRKQDRWSQTRWRTRHAKLGPLSDEVWEAHSDARQEIIEFQRERAAEKAAARNAR